MASTLDTLERLIPDAPRSSPSVSSWSVGMQIHHALLATQGIARALARSTPGEKRPTWSLPRSLVLLTGRIPRGRGKSPDAAIPSPSISESELRALAGTARRALAEAAASDPRAWWQHFAFGVMRRDTALKFIDIHNRHHIAIISDILDASPRLAAGREADAADSAPRSEKEAR